MHEKQVIDAYVRWFETLGKSGVHRLSQFVDRDVHCRNPVGYGHGIEQAAAVFGQSLGDAVDVKTKVLDRATGADGRTVYLRWERLLTDHQGRRDGVSGITELTVAAEGQKIMAIVEYWDRPPVSKKGFLARLFKR